MLGLSSQADGRREHDPISILHLLISADICGRTRQIGVPALEIQVDGTSAV
jgi:hypothetical protein